MKRRSILLTGAGLALAAGAAAVLLTGPAPGPIPLAAADEPKAPGAPGEHTMFGGSPARNMVSAAPVPFSHEFPKREGDEHARVLGDRVKWKAQLGSRAYGGPVVAGGKVFVGTNNEKPRNPKIKGDKGIVMCFREADGQFLWQAVQDKL